MLPRRASFASFTLWRSSASMLRFAADSEPSGALQAGQRLAKPGLSGLSSNSSEQTAQTRRGNAMQLTFYKKRELGGTAVFEFRASHDSGPLSGSGSSWERGWRK